MTTTRAPKLLDYAGIAARTGLSAGTLRKYRMLGYLPEPDLLPTPDRPRWYATTIEDWLASRPGRGNWGQR